MAARRCRQRRLPEGGGVIPNNPSAPDRCGIHSGSFFSMTEKILGQFDLLGDPIPKGFGKRGRPEHIPTIENRNKIRILLAFEWANNCIAWAVRITGGPLKKHYFRVRWRADARFGGGIRWR